MEFWQFLTIYLSNKLIHVFWGMKAIVSFACCSTNWLWVCIKNDCTKIISKIFYRFSAFWLRSKCSICSYQLNIWYEGHRPSSILNWFLDGDRVSAACCGSIMCWPCIAVPQGSAHFPTYQYMNFHSNYHHILVHRNLSVQYYKWRMILIEEIVFPILD